MRFESHKSAYFERFSNQMSEFNSIEQKYYNEIRSNKSNLMKGKVNLRS